MFSFSNVRSIMGLYLYFVTKDALFLKEFLRDERRYFLSANG